MKKKVIGYATFVALIVALFFYFDFAEKVQLRPQSVHQWRQCDGSSLALMYYHNDLKFWQPSVHFQMGNEGRSVGEFPILYYLDACMFKLFGYQESIIKWVNLLIFFLGLLYLFKISELIIGNKWMALIPVVILMTFPVVTYYAPTSIPNIPAMSFMIIGIYYLFRYLDERQFVHLIFCGILTTLAGLLKLTTLLPFFSVMVVFLLGFFNNQKEFKIKPVTWSNLTFIPLTICGSWILWARNYALKNETDTFLMSSKSIFGMDTESVQHVLWRLKSEWIYDYINMSLLIFCIAVFFWLIVVPKDKHEKAAVLMLTTLLLGTVIYFFLFFEQFLHHDYYGIELLYLILTIIIVVLWKVNKMPNQTMKRILSILIVVLSLNGVRHAKKRTDLRYASNVGNNYYDYFELTPKLRANAIHWNDKVVIANDYSNNISLYLTDQIERTEKKPRLEKEQLLTYIDQEAKYLVCKEEFLEKRPAIKDLLDEKILAHESLSVYSLIGN